MTDGFGAHRVLVAHGSQPYRSGVASLEPPKFVKVWRGASLIQPLYLVLGCPGQEFTLPETNSKSP